MNDHRINQLSGKLLTGEISPAEKQELENWYAQFDTEEHLVYSDLTKQEFADQLYRQISLQTGMQTPPVKRLINYRYIAIAASLLLLLSVPLYRIYINPQQSLHPNNMASHIKPGGNKAMLTLANGKTIDLESAANGILATGQQQIIHKTAAGTIVYDATSQSTDENNYNTLTTPRGGKFSLTLADGTLAVLDAASSIRYPLSFSGGNRTVEITGQVYFEVVHHAKQPFLVKAGGLLIEDLGTHFNINAFPGTNGIETTLEEGSVSVHGLQKTVVLKPGQAALGNIKDNQLSVHTADLEQVLAWKNGYFRFNDEPIESIMQQLSRWYDIEVSYSGKLPEDGFNGTISRSKNLGQVLKMLERTGIIHFKTEGRRITVLP